MKQERNFLSGKTLMRLAYSSVYSFTFLLLLIS